jgi:hypothetical protein
VRDTPGSRSEHPTVREAPAGRSQHPTISDTPIAKKAGRPKKRAGGRGMSGERPRKIVIVEIVVADLSKDLRHDDDDP